MPTASRSMITWCATLPVLALFGAAGWAQTATKTRTTGAAAVTTEKMSGEVLEVNGNNLVVRMTNGELRTFSNVPDSRKVVMDGREVGVRDLRPGTTLTARVTKTMTPVAVRTTTVGTGRVWVTAGNTVVLTLATGVNKQYTVSPDFHFIVLGRPATVADLRPGMTVSAERIVEEPTVEIAVNATVVGRSPVAGARAQTNVR